MILLQTIFELKIEQLYIRFQYDPRDATFVELKRVLKKLMSGAIRSPSD